MSAWAQRAVRRLKGCSRSGSDSGSDSVCLRGVVGEVRLAVLGVGAGVVVVLFDLLIEVRMSAASILCASSDCMIVSLVKLRSSADRDEQWWCGT